MHTTMCLDPPIDPESTLNIPVEISKSAAPDAAVITVSWPNLIAHGITHSRLHHTAPRLVETGHHMTEARPRQTITHPSLQTPGISMTASAPMTAPPPSLAVVHPHTSGPCTALLHLAVISPA